MRPSDMVSAAADFSTRIATIAALVGATVAAGDATGEQLESLRASAAGLVADIRSTLRELDRHDETDWLVVEDAERFLAIWQWRRESRKALLELWRLAYQLAIAALELGDGLRQKVVIVREGETWQSIAARELGGWQEWPRLLAANPTLTAGALSGGTTLVVPEKR